MKKSAPQGAGLNFNVLKEAVEFMQANGLAELTWEKGSEKISLKSHGMGGSNGSPVITFNAPTQLSGGGNSPQKIIESKVESSKPAGLQITSPFVGTFYRSPAPGAAAYVTEGQVIRPGDVLCIVEAMKLMNEIESEINGRIVKVLVEDGQPIEYGEPLFLYEKA